MKSSHLAIAALLATGTACDDTAPRGPGAITISASSQLVEPATFQYGISIDSSTPRTLGQGESSIFTTGGLAHGTHTITTNDVPARCTGGERRQVELRGDDTARVNIALQCTRVTGDLSVSVSTSGANPDQNGYLVVFDQQLVAALPPNGSTLIRFLQPGSHSVSLTNVAANCTASGAQSVSVVSGATANAVFTVSCVPAATLQFAFIASGADRDPDGVMIRIDGTGVPRRVTTNVGNSMLVAAGTHTFAISDVAPNCTLAGSATGTFTVAAGDASPITADLTCTEIGFGVAGVSVADATSDTLSNGLNNLSAAHDVRNVSARYAPGWLILVLKFGRPPGSAANNSLAGLHGAVDLDTDENPSTGTLPLINAFGGSAAQGSDYTINFFDADTASVAILKYSLNTDEDIGRVRARHEGDSVIVYVPLAKLGTDDGNMTVTLVIGTADRPTDIAPNSGVITARVPAGPTVATASPAAVLGSPTRTSAPSSLVERRKPIGTWRVPR